MKNFNRPYAATSISDFWKRWHISLSTWFKDYLYISLGGNRVTIPRWYLNLFIVFLVSGLWHGANWTFVIWGGIHGFYIIFGIISKSARNKIISFLRIDRLPTVNTWLQVLTTFTLVCFARIFFRARSVSDAFYIIKNLFVGLGTDIQKVFNHVPLEMNIGSTRKILIALTAFAFMSLVHKYQEKQLISTWFAARPAYVRMGAYYAFIIMIIFLGMNDTKQFIYFQF